VTPERLAVERDGAITRVWLDRPRVLNALDTQTLEEIAAVFGELGPHAGTRIVVLGGRGSSFCAGADRKDPPARVSRSSGAGAAARRHASQVGLRALEAIERCEAITVARLHGHVIGGGLVLALGCDLRLAAASASFHIPEVDLGVPLTWGAAPRLAREVGPARAKELILLCDRFDAAAAERWGLLNRVVADDALDATVDDVAGRLAAKPEWALHMTKTQFQAYARTTVLGDVTTLDGDLLRGAAAEDPTRFAFPPKR
jgi:enoyl-CoA hydratase/carnithine racemase